jgi:hypothetical protein
VQAVFASRKHLHRDEVMARGDREGEPPKQGAADRVPDNLGFDTAGGEEQINAKLFRIVTADEPHSAKAPGWLVLNVLGRLPPVALKSEDDLFGPSIVCDRNGEIDVVGRPGASVGRDRQTADKCMADTKPREVTMERSDR